MRGHEAETYKRILGSHGGRHNGVHEDSFVEKVACYGECLEIVAYEKRDDRSGGVSYLAAHVAEAFESKVGEFPKILLAFGLGNHNVDGFEGGGCGSRCYRRCENIGARVVTQIMGEFFVCGNDAAERCKRFCECSPPQVYLT